MGWGAKPPGAFAYATGSAFRRRWIDGYTFVGVIFFFGAAVSHVGGGGERCCLDRRELIGEGETDDSGRRRGGGAWWRPSAERRVCSQRGDEVDEGGGVVFFGELGECGARFGGDIEELGLWAAGGDEHEVAEEVDEFGEDLFDAHSFFFLRGHRHWVMGALPASPLARAETREAMAAGGRFAEEVF